MDVQPHLGPAAAKRSRRKDETVKFLPALPTHRAKPSWQQTQPSFKLFSGGPPSMMSAGTSGDPWTTTGLPPLKDRTGTRPLPPSAAETLHTGQKRPRSRSWEPQSQLTPISKRRGGGATGVRPLPPTSRQHQRSQTAGSAFSRPRKQREQFRSALVRLILHGKGVDEEEEEGREGPVTGRSSSPTSADIDLLRYLYYINNGVDTEHVAPLEDSWISNILARVGSGTDPAGNSLVTKFSGGVEFLSDEVREEYLLSVKKSIVDFVLKDPRPKQQTAEVPKLPHRQELEVVPKPWNQTFLTAGMAMSETLFVTNPTVAAMLRIWHQEYTHYRLVNCAGLLSRSEVYEMADFDRVVKRDLESSKTLLTTKWLPALQNIFFLGNKRKQIPLDHLEAFFDGIAVVMTNQLREMTLASIADYLHVFCPVKEEKCAGIFSGFSLNLVVSGTVLKFEPDPSGFEVLVTNTFDKMLTVVNCVPRVETKLYPNEGSTPAKPNLSPTISPQLLTDAKAKVKVVLEEGMKGPQEHIKRFEKYQPLITREAEDEAEKFMKEEHTFLEYEKQVYKYQELVSELQYEVEKLVPLGLFELHCDEAVRSLAKRASDIITQLLTRMAQENQRLNQQLRKEYEAIADKALTTPTDTEHLMALKEEMSAATEKTLPQLETRVIEARHRVEFLLEHTTVSHSEVKLNVDTFRWLERIPPILEEHNDIITRSRKEKEDALKFRRDRFKAELESYEKQLKEFETFGDLQEVRRYQKKAQAMKTRLDEALEKIEGFNTEEDAFDWERSQYPQRNKLVNTLDPYHKLYSTIIEFQNKHDGWMDGPMSGVDPDQVENDVGSMWRTLYKMEKSLSEYPNPLKMAQKTKTRVDNFKELQGLIAALFNPGLRGPSLGEDELHRWTRPPPH
ncbi:Dynein heavy chain 7, axonemal [Geodia barretti]|uniref:Dynein heavy chain 7, axonemal n=1 Tax=Geodia barretti TaxID=519541 RepID=A0AA35R5H6_GEOBA|nr:Dynein heavy chain 7, axonemal [Geodia barretti]